eukprot:m.75497 g.75497  ORF g.75497 m.75497 type:complete len:547 (+) comp18968_c0_seq1:354-1994(+)
MADNNYMNEEMICHDASAGADHHVPLDRREQLERLEREKEEDLAANRLKMPKKFSREQEKSRKLSNARDTATALIEQLEASNPVEEPTTSPPIVSTGKRIHKAPSVRVSSAQKAEYDKMAADAQRAKHIPVIPEAPDDPTASFAIGSDYASEDAAADVFAEAEPANPPPQTFDIGFDYAAESDLADVIDIGRKQRAMARQPTITQIPEKAMLSGQRSAAASLLAAELAGHSAPPQPKKIARQKSVSVAVDGPAVSSRELSRPLQQLLRTAWLAADTLSRAQFESLVTNGMEGDFLVRKSGSSAGSVCRMQLIVHRRSLCHHTPSFVPHRPLCLSGCFCIVETAVSLAATLALVIELGLDHERGAVGVVVGVRSEVFLTLERGLVSSRYVLCVNDYGDPVNYSITVDDDAAYEFLGRSFGSLEQVVAHARVTPLKSRTVDGEKLALGFPAIQESWYAAGFDRADVETAVAAGEHGAFAVRMSSSGDKYVLVVNDIGAICSYSITQVNRRWTFGGSAHSTIQGVINHIKVKPFQSKNTPDLRLGNSAM